jgi:hypothetical protein
MGSVPTFPLALVKKGDILESMQGHTACQLKPTLFWPDKPKFPGVTAAFPEHGGFVIFIFFPGENPVKFTDPDGKDFYNFTDKDITVFDEETKAVIVHPGEMYKGAIDGAMLEDGTIVKVTYRKGLSPSVVDVSVENIEGKDTAFVIGGNISNALGDLWKKIKGEDELPSGVYSPEAVERHSEFDVWKDEAVDLRGDTSKVRKITRLDMFLVGMEFHDELIDRE